MEIGLWLILILFSCSGIATHNTCPQFGNEFQSGSYSSSDRLFLNVKSPSQCHGNVTEWKFCYSSGSTSRTYEVQFMLFRQSGSTQTYNRVTNSYNVYRRRGEPLVACTSISLDPGEIFEVQPNDIIGACLRDQGSTHPLRVTISSPNEALYVTSINDDCRDNDLQSLNLDSLTSTTNNVLLVEAIINSTTEYRIGHNPTPSTPMSTSGILINSQFPAQGSGLVTSWNYCYYTDSLSSSNNYSATFAVWRNDSMSSSVTMVTDSFLTVTLQRQNTIASIYCLVVELEPEDHFILKEGDYVGVALPMTNSIPLLGVSTDYTLWSSLHSVTGMSLLYDSLAQTTGALHLYAVIDTSVQVTTQIPDTDQTLTDRVTSSSSAYDTTSSPIESARGSGGIAAAIVIVVLVVIVLTGIAVAVAILFVIRWRKKSASEPQDAIQHGTVKGIDNINYVAYKGPEYPQTSSSSTAASKTESSSNIYLHPVQQTRTRSILEASFYSSVHIDNDDIYASVMEESISNNTYYELEPTYFEEPQDEEETLYGQIHSGNNRAKNIDGNNIQFVKHLGSGQFGNVEEGMWFDGSQEVKVALKTLREDAKPADKVKFLQEAVIMAQFNHDNVIKLLGMVLEDNPMVLVVELASRGDLRKNLLEVREERMDPSLPKLLLYFSRQVVHGMHYLSSKRFVHRDLAARNILLSENCLCKIADFGMSRDLADDNYYASSGGLVPVKWTAPEAIKYKRYSTASDVWSYGCVLYEIWSLGHKPFEALQNLEVVTALDQNIRLAPPTGCPIALYTAMIKCWHPEAHSRPSFKDLVMMLTKDVLEIPSSVLKTVPEFKTPGGSLHIGGDVYIDLQNSYF